MTKKLEYSSLEELRADKLKAKRTLSKEIRALQRDAVDCVLPSNNTFLNSDFSYLRFIGYGITAYKTYSTVRRVMGFVSSRRWK